MTTIVLVGGNGYIGREVTRQWLKRDLEAQFYVTSRSERQEIKDSRVHHIQVDVNDAAAFEKALPEKVDYIVNLTYGSVEALKTIRDFAEKHGAQAIGNIGCNAAVPGFEDFVKMKENELQFLQEGKVRVANYDLTIAYGVDRNDDLLKAVQSGNFDELPPVHVEIVARLLIDRLTKDWLA
ncbi:NAD-dependent epimerase/dehydratase family protein [Bacillus massiliigorillae]|uniref:NAD-dependent epimerase/dehydratase family protein n=1 Tax=Bacillus massiliigorillae TaxID=1243664 RepID=UPI0003A01413|nr:NAD-dependent epimerase/dehydratase family protein [Bacillus massiliigorillae]